MVFLDISLYRRWVWYKSRAEFMLFLLNGVSTRRVFHRLVLSDRWRWYTRQMRKLGARLGIVGGGTDIAS